MQAHIAVHIEQVQAHSQGQWSIAELLVQNNIAAQALNKQAPVYCNALHDALAHNSFAKKGHTNHYFHNGLDLKNTLYDRDDLDDIRHGD